MYISRLSIKNFRNFGDPQFEIALKPFTLLLGENNIGKSNLLCAISLLFSQELSISQQRSLHTDDFNHKTLAKFRAMIADETKTLADIVFPEIVVDALLDDIAEEQHPVVGDWYCNKELSQSRVTYKFSLRHNFDVQKWCSEQRELISAARLADDSKEEEAASANPNLAAQEPKAKPDYSYLVELPIGEYRYTIYGGGRQSNECEAYLLRMLKVEILDALRDAERELVDGGEQRLLYRVLRQNGASRYAEVKGLLRQLKSAIDRDASLTEIKADVKSLLGLVSLHTPGEDHSIGLQFVAPEAAELLKKIGMTYGANPMSVARNGLGRNNLLYIALLLSQLSKGIDPSLLANDDSFVCFRLVGIEEPEAHLHPHLQDHLASNIESIRERHSAQLQLILTSHSTHIAAKLNLENTAVLFRDGADGVLRVHYVLDGLELVKNKDTIRFLSLYLDATRSQLFFARRIILVEGIAEQTIVPILFKNHFGKTPEELGCSVLNVNGVAFSHFLNVVRNGYFKKCVVLTDSDEGTATEDRAANLQAKYGDVAWVKVRTTKESTFEKDLIAANNSGDGKALLFSALRMARPMNGPALETKTGSNDINIEDFFKEVVSYKAAFAFSVASAVKEELEIATKEQRAPRSIKAPAYIIEALDFIKD